MAPETAGVTRDQLEHLAGTLGRRGASCYDFLESTDSVRGYKRWGTCEVQYGSEQTSGSAPWQPIGYRAPQRVPLAPEVSAVGHDAQSDTGSAVVSRTKDICLIVGICDTRPGKTSYRVGGVHE